MNGKLKLLDRDECIADDNEYAGKLLIIKPASLKEEFRQPYFQYFYATSGFGCYPDKLGAKVFGKILADGEECFFCRSDFIALPIRRNCRSGQRKGLKPSPPLKWG